MVKLIFDPSYVRGPDNTNGTGLRNVLPNESVCVLIKATLPAMIGMSEIGQCLELTGNIFMSGKL